jgi:hypothetical protein
MWTLRSEDRLKEWKDFRSNLGNLSFDNALIETVKLWSFSPIVNHHLDLTGPPNWPSPWELLDENKYDDTAKALGMLYTLYLSPHGKDHEFSMVKCQSSSTLENYNLVYVDSGKYILNYVFNEVISSKQFEEVSRKFLTVTHSYTESDLQLSKY